MTAGLGCLDGSKYLSQEKKKKSIPVNSLFTWCFQQRLRAHRLAIFQRGVLFSNTNLKFALSESEQGRVYRRSSHVTSRGSGCRWDFTLIPVYSAELSRASGTDRDLWRPVSCCSETWLLKDWAFQGGFGSVQENSPLNPSACSSLSGSDKEQTHKTHRVLFYVDQTVGGDGSRYRHVMKWRKSLLGCWQEILNQNTEA